MGLYQHKGAGGILNLTICVYSLNKIDLPHHLGASGTLMDTVIHGLMCVQLDQVTYWKWC